MPKGIRSQPWRVAELVKWVILFMVGAKGDLVSTFSTIDEDVEDDEGEKGKGG